MLHSVGRSALGVGRVARELIWLLGAVLVRLRRIEPRELLRHAFEVGNRSLFFITVIMTFVGAIMVIQASTQAARIIGDLSTIGPGFLQLLLREFAPTIICLMVAARAGAGMAAEIGAMTITEQIDALSLSGAEPIGYVVAPRVLGGALGIVPLVIWGALVAHVSGGLAATGGFGVSWQSYLGLQLVDVSDVVLGLCKAVAFGIAVPLVACYAGLNASGGAPGVGKATTGAVIVGSLVVLVLDLVIGTVGHFAAGGRL